MKLDLPDEKLADLLDDVVACLAKLPELEDLTIRGPLTDHRLQTLASLKKLHRLDLSGSEGYTDEGLASLLRALPELQEFSFTLGARNPQ